MRFAFVSRLALMIAVTETPCRRAMAPSVSPDRTVYHVPSAEGAVGVTVGVPSPGSVGVVGAGVGPALAGMRSRWPTRIRFGFVRPLARMMTAEVVP